MAFSITIFLDALDPGTWCGGRGPVLDSGRRRSSVKPTCQELPGGSHAKNKRATAGGLPKRHNPRTCRETGMTKSFVGERRTTHGEPNDQIAISPYAVVSWRIYSFAVQLIYDEARDDLIAYYSTYGE